MSLEQLTAKVLAGGELNAGEAQALTVIEGEDLYDLFYAANRLRREFRGSGVSFCSVINARSGRCPMDCAFCSQSGKHGTNVEEYPLVGKEKVLAAALDMRSLGANSFGIVTSGLRLSEEEFGRVVEMLSAMLEQGVTPCASLGMIDKSRADKLKSAGVHRYHHNLETAGSFYPSVCTTQKYERKLETIRVAKAAGLKVCSGGIFGLGESWEQRIELAITLRELDVDAVPLNFLTPVKGTPMGKRPLLPALEALKIVSIYKFLLPQVEIKICGGRELIMGDLQPLMYLAGADGAMIGNYLTTKGRPAEEDLEMVEKLGLRVRSGRVE